MDVLEARYPDGAPVIMLVPAADGRNGLILTGREVDGGIQTTLVHGGTGELLSSEVRLDLASVESDGE